MASFKIGLASYLRTGCIVGGAFFPLQPIFANQLYTEVCAINEKEDGYYSGSSVFVSGSKYNIMNDTRKFNENYSYLLLMYPKHRKVVRVEVKKHISGIKNGGYILGRDQYRRDWKIKVGRKC